MSYQTIVVPLNGSRSAEHAIPVALSIARHAHGVVRLVHIQIPHVPFYADQCLDCGESQFFHRLEHSELQDLVAHIQQTTGQTCLAEVVDTLDEVRTLCQQQADLLVMAVPARCTLGRRCLGSVNEEVVSHARCPVLTVPGSSVAPAPLEWHCNSILVALDGSDTSEEILKWALPLAPLMEGELHLVRVVTKDYERNAPEARAYLNSIAERLQFTKSVATHVLRGGPVETLILDAASWLKVDAIALETHGYAGFQRLQHGSIAHKLLLSPARPILTHCSTTAGMDPRATGQDSTNLSAVSPAILA